MPLACLSALSSHQLAWDGQPPSTARVSKESSLMKYCLGDLGGVLAPSGL